MEHIFILHSNITYFAAYKHIKKLSNSGCSVTILLMRNQKLIDNELNVKIMDLSSLPILDNPSHPIRNITDFFNKISLKHAYDKIIRNIVQDSEFTLYISNFNRYVQYSLAFNKLCKGYYYIEEGTMSYSSLEYVKKISKIPFTRKICRRLFGFKDYSMLHLNGKFKGTLALSEYAFKWNNKEKHIYNPEDVLGFDSLEEYKYETIIVTDYLSATLDSYINILNDIFVNIAYNTKIGLKFHPQSYIQHKEKIMAIQSYIGENYNNINILPENYIVEKSIFLYHSSIISVNTLSSLSLYCLMSGGSTMYYYLNNGNIEYMLFSDFQKYLMYLEKK